MRHCYHSLLRLPFTALWCPEALLSLSAFHILFISNNFHTIAVRVNVLGKYVSRWAVNDEHEWIFLPALRLFRFGSNTSVNKEPLLSPKDFYSSHDIFLEKKPLVSSQITTHRQLLFLSLCVAGLEDTHIHCASTCVSVQAVCVLRILSAVIDKDSGTRSGPLSLWTRVELIPRKLLSAFGLRWIFLLLPSFVWL